MKKIIILITVFVCSVECISDQQVQFKHDKSNQKVDVYFGDSYFTYYIYPDDMEKQVLYPIVTASGKGITRGYPLNPQSFERTYHPHHIGLWLNFGDVNGLDFWNKSFAIKPEDKHRHANMSKHPNTTFYVLSKITYTMPQHFATRYAVHWAQALVKAWPAGLMSFRLNHEFI